MGVLRWNALSEEEKDSCNQAFAKEKNAPKRALSAFFIFASEIRDEVRENNPDASIGQIGKILGQQWQALSQDRKVIYQTQGEKGKAIYQEALEQYKKSDDYASHQEKVTAWKKGKKKALKPAKTDKKKVVKRKK